MMIFRATVAALAAFLLASCETTTKVAAGPRAPAQAIGARQGERVLDWPWQESDLRPDPNVRFGKLPNGMRYFIRVNHTPSATASFRMRFNTGSLMEDEDQRGLAHFLEHMAFNGSEHVPEGEMTRMLQRHGLSFGAHTNAFTSFDQTVYQLDAPNVRSDTIDTIFFLMRELASNLTLSPDAMERERGVVLSEQRARNTPGFRASLAEWRGLYPNARFSERVPIGLVDVLEHSPVGRLRDFYESYYRPERALFVVSGDFDADAMEAHIRQTFGDWQALRPDPGNPNLGSSDGGVQSGYFYDPGLPTVVSLKSVRPPLREANTSAQMLRGLQRAIADGVIDRRLERIARAPDAPLLSAQIGDDELYDTVAVSTLALTTRPENWEATLAIGEQEIRRALQYGFTQAEVNEQLASLRNQYRTAAQQAATRTSSTLANEMTDEFAAWGVDMDPSDELALFERLVPEMTPEGIHQAFRDEWGHAEPHLFVSSSARIANAAEREQLVFHTSRHVHVGAPVNLSKDNFAYTNFGAPGVVAERHEVADLGISTIRFANNVRLNLKHTDFAHEAVHVSVRYGAGTLELPAAEPGLAMLLQSLPEGGLEAHSADDLQSVLAGRNVGAQASAASDAFVLDGSTTTSDLGLELQLLAAYLTHPGYRDEALQRFHQTMAIRLPPLAATPSGVLSRNVPRMLRSGDPRYGIPSDSDLAARNWEQLRAATARASANGVIEIGIVGDIDINRTIELVSSTFGALPMREAAGPPFTEERRLAFPPGARAATVLHHAGQANRAMALTYWPTTDDSNPRIQRTLELLRAVMSLKLIDRVRESEGATYSPSAQAFFSHANPGYGYLGVSLDLVPENVNRFFGIVDQIAASLAAGEISADELERARRPILDEFRNNQENNDYWMNLVATAQSNPAGLQRHRTTAADYAAVTVADLRAAARHYLVADRAYRIAIMPDAER